VRPFWAGERNFLLKVTKAPVGNSTGTITIAAADVRAGGIAFAWICEPSTNAISTPSGWTQISSTFSSTSNRGALFQRLTPTSADTSITRARTQQAMAAWTMHLEDDNGTVVPITAFNLLNIVGEIFDGADATTDNLNVTLTAGDIYGMSMGAGDGFSSIAAAATSGFTSLGARATGNSSQVADVFFAGTFFSDPKTLADSGSVNFSWSSLVINDRFWSVGLTFTLST
jgi:hypothetical protein